MIHLLDTDVCIPFLNGTDDGLRDRLLKTPPEEVCLCSVVKAELLFGARNSSRVAENLERLSRFFAPMTSLAFDDAAAGHYAVLRTCLQRSGTPIGGNDMLIAAIALANDCTLITRNTGEFARVPGLRLQRW